MGQQLENTSRMEEEASSASWHLDSPLIYLFCGIGAMLALVLVALIMLACAQWKGHWQSTADDNIGGGEHPEKAARRESNLSTEIVVVMAGDELPSYLAAPVHVPG